MAEEMTMNMAAIIAKRPTAALLALVAAYRRRPGYMLSTAERAERDAATAELARRNA
jgi:hypothetical protein